MGPEGGKRRERSERGVGRRKGKNGGERFGRESVRCLHCKVIERNCCVSEARSARWYWEAVIARFRGGKKKTLGRKIGSGQEYEK